MKIFNWIFSVFCILCLPVYGFHIGSILMCLLGVISLPIGPIKELWENLPKPKLRPLIIGILFVAFCCIIPTAQPGQSDIVDEISTETEAQVAEIPETETQETEMEEVFATESESGSEFATEIKTTTIAQTQPSKEITLSIDSIPAYSGKPYVTINDNVPEFLDSDLSTSSYEYYSDLDELGRCGVAYACVGTDLMPTEERGNIGSVKPTGWHTIKYNVVDGNYLYNRCHLIGYQLSGENANTKNLITGTRYLNVDGMLPFENMVADYVKETNNHVMYRVSPIFEGNNLLVSGVQIEAKSVEDNGEGILFNVYCYNVQPNIEINYATGDSSLIAATMTEQSNTSVSNNKNSTSNESINTDVNTIANSANDSNVISKSDNYSGSEDIGSENINSDNAASSSSTNNDNTSNDTGGGGSSSILVWKSATGDKYHSINNCGRMNPAKATQITEEQAIKQGLGKCSKCW